MKAVNTRIILGFIAALAAVSTTPTALGSTLGPRDGSLTRRQAVCNGHAELCERGYGTLAYVGTHNSYAVDVNNFTQQLNDGVRMLQMQAHDESGVIKLCHTDCRLYDGGTLENYLRTVKTWLDANPNEVLSLLIVNSDNVPAARYAEVYANTGMDVVSYSPPTSPLPALEWPTLGSLIGSGQRVITFLSTTANPEIPYLIDQFPNVWETKFNVVDQSNFDCQVDRSRGDPSTSLFLINHYLDKLVLGQPVPDLDKLDATNAVSGFGSLGAHVETCRAVQGRPPNFLLVDFYEYGGGSVFEVAAQINGVPYNPATPVASPRPTAVGTQTAGRDATGGASGSAPALLQGSHLVALLSMVVGTVVIAPLLVF
ncbi:hypothetical protein CC1G_01797 [Coprinopsis cinerea okayama7|uniref:PLC-like phosphodiesterase n=1 Tax=Coprinopsis cinerea (strain Okayama-7 / 130 / ATCC MYA-4618 / FGSC 9003) TaxID=240176 RepID=A8N2E4_COPC7|nr:hypothetical protein CC1G_01797 [Coprinopsis cinerea okayama7\|eukprot:XP_001829117.2 hypothetical protein CC1G_01797 [Coprinopsis cinerea okayama7\